LQDKEGISIKLTEEKPKNNIYYEYIAEKDKLVKDIKVLFICKSIDEMIKTLKESFNKGNVTVDNINNKYIMELEFKGFGVITKSVIELEEHKPLDPQYLEKKIKEFDAKYNEMLKEVKEIKNIKLTINEEKKKKLAKEVEKKLNLNLEDKIKTILLKKGIKDSLYEDFEERILLKFKEMLNKEKEKEEEIKIKEKTEMKEYVKKMTFEKKNVLEDINNLNDNNIFKDKADIKKINEDIIYLKKCIKEHIEEMIKIKSSFKRLEDLYNSISKNNKNNQNNQLINNNNSNNYIELELLISDDDIGNDIIFLNQWDNYKYLKNFEPEDIDIIIYGEKVPIKYKDVNNKLNEDDINEIDKNATELLNTKYSFYYNFTRKGFHSIRIEFKKRLFSCQNLFLNCDKITGIDLSNFDCSQVSSCMGMFSGCTSVKSIEFGKLDFALVTNFKCMFYNCQNLKEVNLFHFNTKNALTFESMFSRCFNLKNLDVSNFNSSKCQKITNMFSLCQNITEIDLIKWNMHNISGYQGISELFYGCKNLKKIKMSSNFKDLGGLLKDTWGEDLCKKDIFTGIPEEGLFVYKKGVKIDLLLNELPKNWIMEEE
jgi:surface protein